MTREEFEEMIAGYVEEAGLDRDDSAFIRFSTEDHDYVICFEVLKALIWRDGEIVKDVDKCIE